MSEPEVSKTPAPSPVEGMKAASHGLRGGIASIMASGADHFEETEKQLLKFHGSYQQEDRDARKSKREDGQSGKFYMFMVRGRIPGGRMNAAQYLVLDGLADSHANGTIRLTSRQSIQFYGILMAGLKPVIAAMNECLLSTLAACGDVNRNVMACPAPIRNSKVHDQLQADCHALAMHLAPKTSAYHEIWIDGKSQGAPEEEIEPIYGKVYLPRKFKTGFALPNDNCIDIFAQDLGLLADVHNGEIVGYDVLVGGGMGRTHGRVDTFAHLGQRILYCTRDQLLQAAEAIVKLYRDHGNRSDRKRARIKYLVADLGVEKIREMLKDYLPFPLQLPKDMPVTGYDSHLGWNEQGDGRYWYGISVENGRVKDDGAFRLRTALRTLISDLSCEVRLTAQQDILLCDLDHSALPKIEKILREHGVQLPGDVSNVQRYSLACPAIPTCSLAICESERTLPTVIDEMEVALKDLGLENEKFSIRMTGCPNGCVRPYTSDIGLVGRSGDKYLMFLGGRILGDRQNFQAKDLVPRAEIVSTLKPLLSRFKHERTETESFGDYCHRLGQEQVKTLLTTGA